MRLLTLLWMVGSVACYAASPDSCVTCHSTREDAKGPSSLIKNDIHFAHGLSCADCHGGDRTSDDPEVSMSRAKGFKGKPARAAIPAFCATCHSNPQLMRQYAPRQRVDQFELYKTSVHGLRLAKGDPNVATCIDCHSVHDIRAVKDSASPVHPLHVAETCSRCHSDSAKMAAYKLPANQFAGYSSSVHWQALAKQGDMSAPTCASCHGNHGAKPPEVQSVAEVCGSCHVLFAQLFDKSVHQAVFASSSGGGGCTVCHSNHAIHQPSTAMMVGPKAVCATCHAEGDAPSKTAAQMASWIDGLDEAIKKSEAVLTRAEQYGMEVSEAQVRLLDGRENLVKSRLALHSMKPEEVRQPIDAGMAIARQTLHVGESALHEKDVRRIGLAVSVVLIGIAIFAIRALLRRIEGDGSGTPAARPGNLTG